jgi:hypothetical protein
MANYQLPFTGAQIQKILDEQYMTPLQDVTGDDYTVGAPLAVSASTEYDFTCNGNIRNFTNLPAHVTSLWNTSTSICLGAELLDTPVLVLTVRFKFDPTVAAAGNITVNPYVNETVPIKFKPVTVPYKATLTAVSALVTIYLGDETGFDVKNKGIFFKFESTGAGEMYDPSIEIYRT